MPITKAMKYGKHSSGKSGAVNSARRPKHRIPDMYRLLERQGYIGEHVTGPFFYVPKARDDFSVMPMYTRRLKDA